jgi:hypothetical protein
VLKTVRSAPVSTRNCSVIFDQSNVCSWARRIGRISPS